MIDFNTSIKYVYRPLVSVNRGFSTVDFVRFQDGNRYYFSVDFPHLYAYMLHSRSIKIHDCNGVVLHVYKDKHRNIIVRYYEVR